MRPQQSITCATEVFVATCLLHKELPDRQDFSIGEIVSRAREENLYGRLRPGVQVHASVHCVANRPPNPLAHSMLYATDKSRRRLLRQGDPIHPDRNAKHWPEIWELPKKHLALLDFAKAEFAIGGSQTRGPHPLLKLVGLGAPVWKGMDADAYVLKLREGWD